MANRSAGARATKLESKTFAHGGNVSIQTSGLIPPGRRILSVDFILVTSFTQPAAAAATQIGASLFQLISQIKIGRRVSISGLGLHLLNWLKHGRETALPASFLNTLNGVFSREIKWTVDYVDRSSRAPYDGAVPSELWTDPIEILFGASSIFTATAPTVAGTLHTIVHHDSAQSDSDSAVVPSSKVIMSQDFSSTTAVIEKAGAWLYALAYREAANDSGSLTSTQVSSFSTDSDGEMIFRDVRLADVAHLFNQSRADGSVRREIGNLNAIPGEALNADPGDADAAGAVVTCECVPLVFPPRDYFVSSQVPHVEKAFKAQFTGTISTYKIAYELLEPLSESGAATAARRMGLAGPVGWKTKAASKTGLPAGSEKWAKFLPQRAVRRK